MAWLVLLLYLLGLLLAFGWCTLTQLRHTGDTGLRLDAGRPGTLRWWAKLLFIAALVLGFAGPPAALAGLPPLARPRPSALHVVGLVVPVAGIAAALAAQLAMGTSWRIGVDPTERTNLVTGGPCALPCNPTFTAMATTSLGLTLLVPNAVSLRAWLVLAATASPRGRGALPNRHPRRRLPSLFGEGRTLPPQARPTTSGLTVTVIR